MFDKPVINIGFPPPDLDPEREFDYTRYYEFEHYRPVVASGAIEIASSKAELGIKLAEALRHPEIRAPQRANLVRSFFGESLDGRSGSRVAEALLEMAIKSTAS
jgi:hypothetical protein